MSTSLLDYLIAQYPQAKMNTLRDMVASKRVRINGTPAKSLKQPVEEADTVEIGDAVGRSALLAHGVRVVYQDNDIAIIDKPAGLLTSTHETEPRPTAFEVIAGYYRNQNQKAVTYLVHRLDRDASGLLVFARTTAAYVKLKEMFAAHNLVRQYTAIVHGKMKKKAGTLKHLLYEGDDGIVRITGDARKGKEALTHYETIGTTKDFSRIRCTLETGRKHQIRVQFKTAGHPICGDVLYGTPEARAGQEPPFRLALHATRLEFAHPRTGKPIAMHSPPPASFRKMVPDET